MNPVFRPQLNIMAPIRRTSAQPPKKRTSKQSNNNLLIAYSYILGSSGTKIFNIGLNPVNFEPVVTIRCLDNTIQLSIPKEWKTFSDKISEINNKVENFDKATAAVTTDKKCIWNFKINTKTCININRMKSDFVFLISQRIKRNKNMSILLDYSEWIQLEAFKQFADIVVPLIKDAQPTAQSFFDQYVAKCREVNQTSLNVEHFFTSNSTTEKGCQQQQQINLSRLFFECSMLLKEKIAKTLRKC